MTAGRLVPLEVLVERDAPTRKDASEMRRRWLSWLHRLAKQADEAHREGMSTSKFTAGKRTAEFKNTLHQYMRGEVPIPTKPGKDLHFKPRYESLFAIASGR